MPKSAHTDLQHQLTCRRAFEIQTPFPWTNFQGLDGISKVRGGESHSVIWYHEILASWVSPKNIRVGLYFHIGHVQVLLRRSKISPSSFWRFFFLSQQMSHPHSMLNPPTMGNDPLLMTVVSVTDTPYLNGYIEVLATICLFQFHQDMRLGWIAIAMV